jgi:hypothetical protein
MALSLYRRGGLFSAFVVLLLVAPASGQFYPPYYPPPGYYGGYGPGAVMQGAASMTEAQGNLMLQQEQARIMREKANQAKIETKKQNLDWQNYERANTPTFTEEQAKIKGLLVHRMLTNPLQGEVVSGVAQNTIMPYLYGLTLQGIPGPPVRLDPELMRQINVRGAGGSGGSLALLKDRGKVTWPLALRGPYQEELDGLLPQVVSATVLGNLTPKLYKEVRSGVDNVEKDLKNKFFKDEVDAGSYMIAKRFVNDLRSAVNALQQPNAAKILDGAMAAKGRTVQELVQNMTQNGLRFAPALPGQEPAYFALQSAMASYAAGAQSPSGFRVQAGPPPGYASQGYPPR